MYTRKDLLFAIMQVLGAAGAMTFVAPFIVACWNDAIISIFLLLLEIGLSTMLAFGAINTHFCRKSLTEDKAKEWFLSMNYSQRREIIDLIPQSGLLDLFEDDSVQQQSAQELKSELVARYSNDTVAGVVARCEVR